MPAGKISQLLSNKKSILILSLVVLTPLALVLYFLLEPEEKVDDKKILLANSGIDEIDAINADSMKRPQLLVFLRHFG